MIHENLFGSFKRRERRIIRVAAVVGGQQTQARKHFALFASFLHTHFNNRLHLTWRAAFFFVANNEENDGDDGVYDDDIFLAPQRKSLCISCVRAIVVVVHV